MGSNLLTDFHAKIVEVPFVLAQGLDKEGVFLQGEQQTLVAFLREIGKVQYFDEKIDLVLGVLTFVREKHVNQTDERSFVEQMQVFLEVPHPKFFQLGRTAAFKHRVHKGVCQVIVLRFNFPQVFDGLYLEKAVNLIRYHKNKKE